MLTIQQNFLKLGRCLPVGVKKCLYMYMKRSNSNFLRKKNYEKSNYLYSRLGHTSVGINICEAADHTGDNGNSRCDVIGWSRG